MKTKVNGKVVKDSREIDNIKKITSVSVEIENETKVPGEALKLEPFTFDENFIPLIIKKMERSSATEGTTTFENCGNLLGYTLSLYLQSPKYKPTWKRKLKNLLERYKLIE